jgi:hypothetical protein
MPATWWIYFGFGTIAALVVFFGSNVQGAHKTLPSHGPSPELYAQKKLKPTAVRKKAV